MVANERIDARYGMRLRFKAENLQHVGAFKARGAANAVLALPPDLAALGVVTHSSGNHAAALARAARLRNIPAHIVMPRNSAQNKIDAVRSYGIEPVFCQPTAESRQAEADRIRAETGATLVHPYDDPAVMAGQGTVGLELLEQVDDLQDVIVPVGGGGLASGVLVAIKSLRPEVRVYAAEPALADDAYRSLQSGRIEMPVRYDTVADGLRTPLGQHTFPVLQSLVDDILRVPEERILPAVCKLLSEVKLLAEPSGAVALAAALENQPLFAGRTVAVVVSGGNIDLDRLPAVISSD
ncbi:MAG: threonine/serine dehydratase [Planctomycetota bacterium]|nr:MAG: threonine/serine dehydratase [Planctomycetota bacterium]